MSAYTDLIEETTTTITSRARNFRNLVVAVALVSTAIIITAFTVGTFAIASLFGFLIPLIGFFFLKDAKLLAAWRNVLLEHWVTLEIDFFPFIQAVSANPAIPKGTLDGMLLSLPAASEWKVERQLSPLARAELARYAKALADFRQSALLQRTLAAMGIATLVSSSAFLGLWQPLLLLSVTVFLPILSITRTQRFLNIHSTKLGNFRALSTFEQSTFFAVIAKLDWGGLPKVLEEKSLKTFSTSE